MTDEIVIGGDSGDIPPGTYEAKLVSVTVKTSVEFGDFRAWDFELIAGNIVGGGSSMMTGAKSKGGRWIAALLGRKPDKGENVTQAIIGARCLVVVGLDKNDWPKVTDVLPPIVTGSVPAATPQTTPEAPPRPAAVESGSEGGKVEILADLPF